MRNPHLYIKGSLSTTDPSKKPVLIIGQKPHLKKVQYEKISCKLLPRVNKSEWLKAVNSLNPSPTATCPLYLCCARVAALPLKNSHHNTPSRSHSITKLTKSFSGKTDEYIVLVIERENMFASVCAVARAYPTYIRKSVTPAAKSVTIEILLVDEKEASTIITDQDLKALSYACEGIRLAAYIVDAPANEMDIDTFIEEVKTVGNKMDITLRILRGEELLVGGFGGIYGVGKSSLNPPAVVLMSHMPPGATENIAWVGKGIVFDSGGLNLKSQGHMTGMKRDCGGAAAILGAFYAAVESGFSQNLHAIFCLAENSIGPSATRPDDILTLLSGKTVEINDTDAEGRLVLSDGVVFAAKNIKCKIILDMATLTGCQGMTTGKYHAAILTNTPSWEGIAVSSGRASGDLIHPLPYTPELHFSEFSSSVADMKNSVSRSNNNPLSTCAGLFIGAHLGFEFPGDWIHIDMAAPVHVGDRATGYGVALLVAMFSKWSHNPLIKSLSSFPNKIENYGTAIKCGTTSRENQIEGLQLAPHPKKIRLMDLLKE